MSGNFNHTFAYNDYDLVMAAPVYLKDMIGNPRSLKIA